MEEDVDEVAAVAVADAGAATKTAATVASTTAGKHGSP